MVTLQQWDCSLRWGAVAVGTLTASAVPAVPAVAVQVVLTPRKARMQGLVVQAKVVSGEMVAAAAPTLSAIPAGILGTVAVG